MKKFILAITMLVCCLMFVGCDKTELADYNAPEDARKVELSGKAEDSFIAQRDCYVEGEDVVLFIEEGVTVKGDMLAITEKIMGELSEGSGKNFEKNYTPNGSYDACGEYFGEGVFDDINTDNEKIMIIIVNNPENKLVQQAFPEGAVLDASDYDLEETGWQTIYHELSHVLHLRNGEGLSSTMNEGFAAYNEDRTQRRLGLPSWDAIQYYSGMLFDDSVIALGEEGFSCYYEVKDDNYQYGFRFMSFLVDVYGDDIFFKIVDAATADGYNEGYDYYDRENSINADTEHLKKIIKSQTSDDVFEEFADWYEENWENECDEYYAHLSELGLW